MLVTAVGCLGVYEFISSRQSYTATAVIQYAGPNASEGLNADGTRIDPSEITSASVINKTIQDLGLTASTESIRPRISVQEVIPEDEETKKETALSNGDEYEYYPTTYAVSFTVDSKDATDYARNVLDSVLTNYFSITARPMWTRIFSRTMPATSRWRTTSILIAWRSCATTPTRVRLFCEKGRREIRLLQREVGLFLLGPRIGV